MWWTSSSGRQDNAMTDIHDKPLAASGLISYRCRGMWGWIMIGARDDSDARREALRSTPLAKLDTLEVWNGEQYVRIAP